MTFTDDAITIQVDQVDWVNFLTMLANDGEPFEVLLKDEVTR